jgi:hypothetical protein
VISLGGGENDIGTVFGKRMTTDEPLGSTVFNQQCGRFAGWPTAPTCIICRGDRIETREVVADPAA